MYVLVTCGWNQFDIFEKKINPSMNLRSLIRKEFDCKAQMFDTFERLNINHFEYVELSKITMYVLITYDC